MCPNCGSLPRARGLWNRIKDHLDNKVVLHFSPSRSIKEAVSRKTNTTRYLTTDYEGEFDTEFHFDIENIDLEDKSIDVIICYHVLEHIINDGKALSELYRILKPGGSCYIQTPFKEDDIYEDFSITDPKERIIHFGQDDHVRIYSPEGLKQRITQAGFNAEIIKVKNEAKNYNGYKEIDITIMCYK
jgi:SAM-dependent methyltransferase